MKKKSYHLGNKVYVTANLCFELMIKFNYVQLVDKQANASDDDLEHGIICMTLV